MLDMILSLGLFGDRSVLIQRMEKSGHVGEKGAVDVGRTIRLEVFIGSIWRHVSCHEGVSQKVLPSNDKQATWISPEHLHRIEPRCP